MLLIKFCSSFCSFHRLYPTIFLTFCLFFFFPNSSHVIVFRLYNLVICIVLVVYNAQTTLCKGTFFSQLLNIIFIEFWGRLVEQAPIFLSFLSFSFSLSHWLNTSEDDFSEDEWLKSLPP